MQQLETKIEFFDWLEASGLMFFIPWPLVYMPPALRSGGMCLVPFTAARWISVVQRRTPKQGAVFATLVITGMAMPNGLMVLQWINGWGEQMAITRVAEFLGDVGYENVPQIESRYNTDFSSEVKESKNQKIWDKANTDDDSLSKYLNSRGLFGTYQGLRLHPRKSKRSKP